MAGGVILGIDPGVNGALAFVHPALIEVFDMPVLKAGKGHLLNEGALSRMLDARSRDIEYAILEQQWARPTDGGSQAFKVGMNFGALKMLLASNFIPYRMVSPHAWKRFMKVSADKDSSRALASQLAPKWADQWSLRKHEGRAEAVLIALYGVSHPVVAEAA